MKIQTIKIEKLFNQFDYTIELNQEDNLTILTGPNGYGKTTILNILYALFSFRFYYFQKLEFKSIKLVFDDKSSLIVEKELNDESEHKVNFNIYSADNTFAEQFIYSDIFSHKLAEILLKELPLKTKDKYQYYNYITLETFSLNQLLSTFEDNLPLFNIKEIFNLIFKENFQQLDINKVHFIKEQRLTKQKYYSLEKYRNYTSIFSTIKLYSDALTMLIKQQHTDAYTFNEKLTNSFAKRLASEKEQFTEDEFNQRLKKLIKKQKQLIKYGLFTSTQEATEYNKEDAKFLSLYLKDSESRANYFDDILNKFEILTSILNSKHFTNKTISINTESGFAIRTKVGKKLEITDLSSGEQNLIILLYELLFVAENNSLILIDEPEISLHVTWQKAFINDLMQISNLKKFALIIATHSPQIINNRWDNTLDLFELSGEK